MHLAPHIYNEAAYPMNVKLFSRLIVSLSFIGILTYYSSEFTQENPQSWVISLPAVIVLAPFLIWHQMMKFSLPVSTIYYLAAGFFDIVLYSFALERLVSVWKNWRARKRR